MSRVHCSKVISVYPKVLSQIIIKWDFDFIGVSKSLEQPEEFAGRLGMHERGDYLDFATQKP